MKGLLKLAVFQLLTAFAAYLLLFILGSLGSIVGWLAIIAAIVALAILLRGKIRYPWWWLMISHKLRSILPRFDGR